MKHFSKVMIVFILASGVFVWGVLALAGGGGGVSADEALQRLLAGNKRYVDGKLKACGEATKERRESLAKSQQPYAAILACSDSRVPPEIIFDQTLGDIFVIRVAGNVPDPIVLGSMEYAVEHLGSPLVMVLGHERCGAVTSAVDARGKTEGNISSFLRKIMPAVDKAKAEAKGKSREEVIEQAADYNVHLTAESIITHSPVVRQLVKEGKVKVVKAKYDLDSGKVTLY